ncbi:MAG: 1-phosphofructokinase family hexose kinase [Solobacterium sp.]|nr:1-phosphofructokinase family hexose kinase [Solobacterium sp.]
MICTCTLNPSLDYYMEFSEPIETSRYNRSKNEFYEAGGKGINVSIVLNNLMVPTRAYGFLGGFTRDFYIQLLQKYEYIQPNFTFIDGHTRINVKLHDGTDTDINAKGPYITHKDMSRLREKVKRLDMGDYFVLAGQAPAYLTEDIIDMLGEAIENGVKVVLDTNPDIERECLRFKPFLLKTTPEELSELLEREITTDEELVAGAKEVFGKGAKNVIIVENKREAMLVCDKGIFECDLVTDEKTVSTVGTADSLVAGFLMNYLRSADAMDSFHFGVCCGCATAYSKGMATREKIESYYQTTDVRRIGTVE